MTLRAFFIVLFGFLVISCVAMAQSRQKEQPQLDSPQAASTWPGSPYGDRDLENDRASEQDDVCFTMRTYLFVREDDGPTRLVATYTCTPSRQRDLKRAKAEPKLIPAK